ncbi:MAG TPA: hypothetical protein VNN80_25045, partial [Polyangiaceae bacterium]|nr:hypothetical protein [Polyangiaceae bacterium]
SLTTEHAAPKGPGAERPKAEEGAPPEPDGCDKAAPERAPAAGGAPGQPRKNRPCPPPASGD